ncbi:hypothetical protein [Ensifer sp. 4252]|uniref:hypothetical protein n=1 Tax=Ensifer sp. 4252 TaxID=3373915 RepID=UPI003D22472E
MFAKQHLNIFHPDDLNVMEAIFEETLIRRRLPRTCEEAERIAETIISMYRSGITDPAALRQMVEYV